MKAMKVLGYAENTRQMADATGCLPSCELYIPELTMKVTSTYRESNNTGIDQKMLRLTVHNDQEYIPVEEVVLSYDNLDAMADVGGYLGLLLGASCLSIASSFAERTQRLFKRVKHY